MYCTHCRHGNPDDASFCMKCGHPLAESSMPPHSKPSHSQSERKQVTILFSDLSGYTAMNEKLDPEEAKDIMSRIFGEIAQVIANYEGFIERFVGDAVMAVFGVPLAHEDDPVRAIRAAMEIHNLVEAISPKLEGKIGRPLSMHSGINTGQVVTGEVDLDKGIHGLTGDPINLASRLQGLAVAGEILVGESTQRLTDGYFNLQAMEPTQVKGKAEPVQVFKVLSVKEEPAAVHRMQGVRSVLIGREAEIAFLTEAVDNLKQGKGSIVSIVGEAGTGKSRLTREFRATLDNEGVQWFEGHAYPYTQNTPYYPLINLLTHAFGIAEADKPGEIKRKVESGMKGLLWDQPDAIPYIGGLFSLKYPEIDEVSPEFWRAKLYEYIQEILKALARRGPTVICVEDLHWADSPFIELLNRLLRGTQRAILFICVSRPLFSLFPDGPPSNLAWPHRELILQPLSQEHTQAMLESLLDSPNPPDDLRSFIKQKVEGNPFYLEEVVNSLIETDALKLERGTWRLTGDISQAQIPSTIQGVLSARLDRLEREAKRVLQEASVIGRAFFYEILKRITQMGSRVESCLSGLERLDLIRTRSLEPDLEYIFKHALTQEVVYNGLLKKERRDIHQRIGQAMEQLFTDRVPEFYEALAFHFKRGESIDKAVEYLIKAGEKSFNRYSVEEAHGYFQEAYELLANKPDKNAADQGKLIDLLLSWALIYYFRGDFGELTARLREHLDMAESLGDRARLGMFYAWYGFSILLTGQGIESLEYLNEALKIGEELGDPKILAYANTWLPWTKVVFGMFNEALDHISRAQEIYRSGFTDPYVYYKSMGAYGWEAFFSGNKKRCMDAGEACLAFGRQHSNIRSMSMGHFCLGTAHFINGDFSAACREFEAAREIAEDPFYKVYGQSFLGFASLQIGELEQAEEALQDIVSTSKRLGFFESWGKWGAVGLGTAAVAKGYFSRGMKIFHSAAQSQTLSYSTAFRATTEMLHGQLYLQMVLKEKPLSLSLLMRNAYFLIKNLPFAAHNAEKHLQQAIHIAQPLGAEAISGPAYLYLGQLHKAKKRMDKARECLNQAIRILEKNHALIHLEMAKRILVDLGRPNEAA